MASKWQYIKRRFKTISESTQVIWYSADWCFVSMSVHKTKTGPFPAIHEHLLSNFGGEVIHHTKHWNTVHKNDVLVQES